MIRSLVLALALGAFVNVSVQAQPKAVTDDQMKRWVAKSLELKPDEQEAAFRAKMGELNPKFDPSAIKVVADKDGVVREVTIPTAYAEDIRPVAVFRDLEKLSAHASAVHPSKLADVSCLRGLTKLKEFSLGSTSVVKLSPLAELKLLEKLYLPNTPVKDISVLKGMPLTAVELPAGVAAKDLQVLKGKPLRTFVTHGPGPDTAKQFNDAFSDAKLETYRVGRSDLDDLRPLANMPLVALGLGESPKLKSLAPLKACAALQSVSFSHAPLVTDLTPLAKNTLTSLELPYCLGIRDLTPTPVKDMPNLLLLSLYGTRVNDLTPVAGLQKLEKLWISETQVKSLKPLADMPNLKSLDLRKAAVADKDFTPITKLPALKTLVIDVNPTTAALIKKIVTLETLNNKPVGPPK